MSPEIALQMLIEAERAWGDVEAEGLGHCQLWCVPCFLGARWIM